MSDLSIEQLNYINIHQMRQEKLTNRSIASFNIIVTLKKKAH